jgi:hypothetical protein
MVGADSVGAGSCPKAGAREYEGRVKNGITFDGGALIARGAVRVLGIG